ncbi:hypothetical protein ACFOHS_18330 [Jhaorihella thermophila]
MPEGLTVFALPEHHRRRLRPSNLIDRAIRQEPKPRTVKVRGFPNEKNRWNASSPPCWSRSTNNGPSTPRPISNGDAGMGDHAISEFPDIRLRNPIARIYQNRY